MDELRAMYAKFQKSADKNGSAEKKTLRLREQMNNILVRHTGQSLKKVEKDTDRDLFMTGKQAVEYGLVDEVIITRPGKLKV